MQQKLGNFKSPFGKVRGFFPRFNEPCMLRCFKKYSTQSCLGTNYWRNRVLKVAQDYKKVHFAVSNKDDFSHELDEYGLGEKKTSEKPIVAAQGEKGEKFFMTDEFRY